MNTAFRNHESVEARERILKEKTIKGKEETGDDRDDECFVEKNMLKSNKTQQ